MSAMTEPVRGRGAPRFTQHLRRSRLAYVLAAVAAVAVGGAATAVGGGGSTAATTTSRTVAVASGVVQSTVSGSGNLAAVKQSDLSFGLAGEITKVYVKDGEKVTEGQVLARLAPTDTTEDITWLRAPFDGTIASIGIAKGDTVSGTSSTSASTDGAAASTATGSSTSSTAAFTLVQLERYEMEVSLSESDIGKVSKGQIATVTVSATGKEYSARVVDVGVLSSSSSSSSATGSSTSSAVAYPVTVRLTHASADIKPGMTASADIVTSQSTGLTVPTQALRGSMVTVVSGTTQTPTRVTTGVTGDSVTEITSGLKQGDKVLVTSTSAAAGAASSGSQGSQQSQQQTGIGGGGFPGGAAGAGFGGPPAGAAPGMGR